MYIIYRIGPCQPSHSGESVFLPNAITRNWIIYNRPSRNSYGTDDNAKLQHQKDTNGYAGVLLGLGLSGHLKSLKIYDINEFLTQVDRQFLSFSVNFHIIRRFFNRLTSQLQLRCS
jgi:hypothetical protein